MANPNASGSTNWHWMAILAMFWWGVWGFLVKIGADSMTPQALQILFVVGMIPALLLALLRTRFVVQFDRKGILYGILNGVLATFGMLAFYYAMGHGKASVVAPMTAIFPLFTVIGAMIFLKERLNKVQMMGIVMALIAVTIFSR